MSLQCIVNLGFKRKTYPIGYVLMSGKRKVDYVKVFERLKACLQHGDQGLKVQTVLMDFELAVWKAVLQYFPGVKVRGCWFHYCQAIYRKAKSLGLTKGFNKKRDINLLVRHLMNLALLDPEAIRRLFEALKQAAGRAGNESVDKLMDYVQSYWINGPFTPEDWTCYGQDIRTNNEIECWNGKLWIEANYKPLNIYQLSDLLHTDASRALRNMHRKESNYTKPTAKRTAAKIRKCLLEYVGGKSAMDTLKKLAQDSEALCHYVRPNQRGTGDTDEILMDHFESQ